MIAEETSRTELGVGAAGRGHGGWRPRAQARHEGVEAGGEEGQVVSWTTSRVVVDFRRGGLGASVKWLHSTDPAIAAQIAESAKELAKELAMRGAGKGAANRGASGRTRAKAKAVPGFVAEAFEGPR